MESQLHIKQLFSQSVIYGLGIMLNKSVGFILIPVYTRYFAPEQIGLFTLVQSISFFLGAVYMFGLETSFMKFFISAKDHGSRAVIFSSTLTYLFISSLILSGLIYINAAAIASVLHFNPPGQSTFLIQILSVMMLIDTLSRFPLLLFRAQLDSKTYAYINLLAFVINILSNLFFIVILQKGIESIFYSYIISVLATLMLGLFLTRKYLIAGFSFGKIKELLIFGNKFIYIGLCVLFIDTSDRFFLKFFYDESTVGIYSANYRLASVMGFLIASFKFSWTPYFLNLKSNPQNKEIISTIFTYFIFAGITMFLIFSLLIKHLVKIEMFGIVFLDVNYWEGLRIVPLILLSYFFSGVYSTLNAAPFFTEKTISILIITIGGLVINTILNFLLIPRFEMTGAAMSTMLTYLIMLISIYIYSQKIYKIDYQWNKILGLLTLAGLFFVIGILVQTYLVLTPAMQIVISIVLIAFYLFLVNAVHVVDLKKIKLLWR